MTSAYDLNLIDFVVFVGIDMCVFLMVGRIFLIVVELFMWEGNKLLMMLCCVI